MGRAPRGSRVVGGVLAAAAAGIGGCAAAPAPKPISVACEAWSYEGRAGRRYTTDHFDIYSTLADAEFEAALPAYLEAAHAQYTDLLPPPADSSDRLQTYVFNTRGQWERFTRENFPARYPVYRKISAGGYAEGSRCVVYDIRRMYTLSVLAHEGMHQYFANHFRTPLPAWLNEGMATYCESFELPRGKPVFTPTRNTFRLNALRDALSTGSVLSLPDILGTNAGAVIDQGRSGLTTTYYAQVWAMVTFVRHGQQGKYADGFARLLADIVSGELPQMAQAARIRAPHPADTSYGEAVFRAYISEDLEGFQKEFNDYMFELAGFRRPGEQGPEMD